MSITLETEDLEQLKIKCTSTLCDKDLHCFLPTRKKAQRAGGGPCRKCKKDAVDFTRIARRDIGDISYTFASLQKETIRAKFWRKPIAEELLLKALTAGPETLRAEARTILARVIGETPKGNRWDSMQTPFEGNVLFFAQHATACCCRRCVQEWHGIPNDRALTGPELDYFVGLMMGYLEQRLPFSDLGEKRV